MAMQSVKYLRIEKNYIYSVYLNTVQFNINLGFYLAASYEYRKVDSGMILNDMYFILIYLRPESKLSMME